MTAFMEDVASGVPTRRLRIMGRPGQSGKENYVLLEEPGPNVLMHYHGKQIPHYKMNCPNCKGDEPRPFWYVGAWFEGLKHLCIVELTAKCFETAEAAARRVSGKHETVDLFGETIEVREPMFRGLYVTISQGGSAKSPRILRCSQRSGVLDWPYRTREELARIWGIPIKPRLFKEA
jgi:hypothetical protein